MRILMFVALLLAPLPAWALCADVATCKQEVLDSDLALLEELQAVGVTSLSVLRNQEFLDAKTLAELQAIRQGQWDYTP